MHGSPMTIATSDPEEWVGAITPLAGEVRISPLEHREFAIRSQLCPLPGMALFDVRTRPVEVRQPEDANAYGVTIARKNAADIGVAGKRLRVGRGEVQVADPRIPFELRAPDLYECLVLRVDRDLVDRHVGCDSDVSRSKCFVRPMLDSRSAAGAALVGYAEYLWQEIRLADSPFRTPLVAQEAAQTAAALIAASCVDSRVKGELASGESTVMRAEEFLLAHLTTPVSAADVAEHVGVSVRSLSRGFNARHGMGPMAFLRARRFEAASEALRNTSSGEVSVTDVALRYGFSHLGRFSIEYRRRFGESPSETLIH